jgi:hypothetical protein
MPVRRTSRASTGIRFDATQQERTHDESGKALRVELKRVGSLGNFHYIDNLARSLKHTGPNPHRPHPEDLRHQASPDHSSGGRLERAGHDRSIPAKPVGEDKTSEGRTRVPLQPEALGTTR